MKTYTSSEIRSFIGEIESGKNKLEDKISKLTEKRKTTKIWDIKSKKEIDRELEGLYNESSCYAYSIMMLQMYEGSLRPDSKSMDTEKLIKCEKEAEVGDGLSKLIIFCHKCFTEQSITERDLKRLEIEASEGDRSSAYILFGYNMFFAEPDDLDKL